MGPKLRNAFNSELQQAIEYYNQEQLEKAFSHLERAHILGQSFVIPHTRSHWWMLKVGFKRSDVKEVAGQINRMMASVLFSRIWVPLGNTGGANVNPVKPMDIPEDLQKILNNPN